jgi:hypothetical protein
MSNEEEVEVGEVMEMTEPQTIAEEMASEDRQDLKVAIIGGDNVLSRATARAFDVPKGVEVQIFSAEGDSFDECLAWKPNVAFWCDEISVKKNDTLNDADFIASVQRLIRSSGAGVCIRSSINIETFERMMMALTRDVFQNKITYMPDLSDSLNVQDMINSPVQVIGGTGKALEQHIQVLRGTSWFNADTLLTGTVPDVIYTRLGVSGYKMVQQKYFDELHEAVMDMKNANPMIVNRLVCSALGNGVTPNFVTGAQEYDGRIFAGATDTLTLIENCLS